MKIMAVDFGDARTGIAICDELEMLASPVKTIEDKNLKSTAKKTAALANELMAKTIVVGNPINMNGTEGPRSQLCRDFASELEKLVKVPVVMWDERSTTVSAANFLNQTNTRGKKRKAVIDTLAATIILENYLSYRKNNL